MRRSVVFGQVLFGGNGKASRDPLPVQLFGRSHGRIIGNTERQPAFTDTKRHPDFDAGAGFLNQVAAGDAHVDRAFITQRWDVVGSQENQVDRQPAGPREQASILASKPKSRRLKQIGRQFTKPTFAGGSDPKVVV